MKKLLYTFFFGYAALKWRRLVRTLILIPTYTYLIFLVPSTLEGIGLGIKPLDWLFAGLRLSAVINSIATTIGIYIVIGLISWVIKPFIIKEN
mgnify:FL=1